MILLPHSFQADEDHFICLEIVSNRQFASVGLRVSVSYDLGEIACEITCNLIILFINILFVDIRYTY